MVKNKEIMLITGANRGIGFAIVKRFSRENYFIYATYRRRKNASQLFKLAEKIQNIRLIKADITKEFELGEVVRTIIEESGRIDLLIPNAAHVLFGPIETVSMRQMKKQFEVTVFGVLKLIQLVLPHMRKSRRGRILCFGSSSSIECSPMYGMYAAAKAALEQALYALAVNIAYWNIRVNIVELTAVSTGLYKASFVFGAGKNLEVYENYLKNSYEFIEKIIKGGEDPNVIADRVLQLIATKGTQLRLMGTPRASEIFNRQLKDPYGTEWLEISRKQEEWYQN